MKTWAAVKELKESCQNGYIGFRVWDLVTIMGI